MLKKNRKKHQTATWLIAGLLMVAVFGLLAGSVLAQASLGVEAIGSTGLGDRDLKETIVLIINILLGFLGIIAVIIIMYGGYVWMTAGGLEDKVSQAKRIIINGVIGLVIILASYGIATFVISVFGDATQPGTGQGGKNPFTYNTGALGGGVLSSVYPEPGANDVPRNTLIMVSFREAMEIESIIDLDNQPDSCSSLPPETSCGYLQEDAFGQPTTAIINRSDETTLTSQQVVVVTNDGKNFVYDPVEYLGSSNDNTNYSVNLTDNINKANGGAAFLAGGYIWSFEISNVLDLTPPRVQSTIPLNNQTVYRNAVVQINFNEAVNVAGATGLAEVDQDGQLIDGTFNNIRISYEAVDGDPASTVYVSGNFEISNNFRTVEFITDQICTDEFGNPVEENSCGLTPKCLPASEELTLSVIAALVDGNGQTIDIFSGITDASGNSLDGNSNDLSEGPPIDNYVSSFLTNNKIDLTPPQIISPLQPEQNAKQVARNEKIKAIFNEYLRASTANLETAAVYESACGLNLPNFPLDQACYPSGGFSVYLENFQNDPGLNGGEPGSILVIKTYNPYLDPLTNYNSRLTAEIQDLYQNCFNPSVGP